jgi:hypothetical protein
VPGGAAVRAGRARRRGEVHHPVAARPARHLDGQVPQQPGQPGQVIAGTEDGQDVRVAVTPVPSTGDPHHDVADCAAVTAVASLAGPSRTASSGSVHEVRPGSSAAMKEYGQPGIICAFPFARA